ncbi:MAG TPA: hypothetical protein VI485_22195 [Vicinamibacterales bacterium]|nr:hypothetical protein [Vicinamibacterales bacterium]
MCPSFASAQQLLDKVLARIGIEAITRTDVQAGVGLGLVEATSADDPAALLQVVERQLVLNEVARFPPAEPPAAEIDQQVAAMKMRAGAALEDLLRSTGLDESRVRALARDTLRIRAYLAQRFGTSTQVSDDEVRRYYEEHRDQFMRNGMPIPFEGAEADARQRASAARLRTTVAQWLRDLQTRSQVVLVK